MNLFKKILSFTSILILLSLLSGYFYFDRKFTPDKNYLHVSNESGTVKIKWENEAKKAMLLPVHFSLDTVTYYMQFDTGSPYTVCFIRIPLRESVKLLQLEIMLKAVLK